MSLSPVANIAPNYRDYKNWWLKFYEAGTTIPKEAALNSTGAPTVSKLQINKDGFITSEGGAIVFPYVSNFYDAYLFPTEAEADANNTVNAVRVADGNIVAANTSGSGLVITSFTELVTLTAGQTTVNFSEISTIQTAIYVSGPLVDDGRLLPTRDYNVVNDTQLILTSSYPAGTTILGVQNESAESEDLDITVVDNVSTAMINSPLTSGKMALSKRYYAGGDVVQGLLYEIVPGGTGTANGGTFIDLSNGNQARLIYGEFINVKQFGAVGDGVTDDTAAVSNALDEMISSGRCLMFPEGEYRIDSLITKFIPAELRHFQIKGIGRARIFGSNVNGCFRFDMNAINTATVQDLWFEPTIPNAGSALRFNIRNDSGNSRPTLILSGLRFGTITPSSESNYFNYGLHLSTEGGGSAAMSGLRMTDSYFAGGSSVAFDTTGIYIDGTVFDFTISSTNFTHLQYGVRSPSAGTISEGIVLDRCVMVFVKFGMWLKAVSGLPYMGISNSHVNATKSCIYLENYNQSIITDNLFYLFNGSTETTAYPLHFKSVNTSQIMGNTFPSSNPAPVTTHSHMFIDGGTKNNFSNNVMRNGLVGITLNNTGNNTLQNNLFDTIGDDIDASTALDGNLITGRFPGTAVDPVEAFRVLNNNTEIFSVTLGALRSAVPIQPPQYDTPNLPDPTINEGRIVYDTTTNKLLGSNGTIWNDLF